MTVEQRYTLQKALAGPEKSELIGLLPDQAERIEKLEQEVQRLCSHLEERTGQLLPIFQDENGTFPFAENECPFDLQETERKVARRIAKHRQHLFTFLYHDKVPATNNLAERQLCPAVIQRKIPCGNKTAKGAKARKIIRSLEATSLQNGQDFSDSVSQATHAAFSCAKHIPPGGC